MANSQCTPRYVVAYNIAVTPTSVSMHSSGERQPADTNFSQSSGATVRERPINVVSYGGPAPAEGARNGLRRHTHKGFLLVLTSQALCECLNITSTMSDAMIRMPALYRATPPVSIAEAAQRRESWLACRCRGYRSWGPAVVEIVWVCTVVGERFVPSSTRRIPSFRTSTDKPMLHPY